MKKLKVDKSESYDWSIVVDEKELRRLDEMIKKIFSDSKKMHQQHIISNSQTLTNETSEINDVISEENLKIAKLRAYL